MVSDERKPRVTPADLDRWEALAGAATPGGELVHWPTNAEGLDFITRCLPFGGEGIHGVGVPTGQGGEWLIVAITGNGPTSRANAEVIREAPAALGALCAEVRRLSGALREIALAGTDRPAAMGPGDDGDGWWKRIAQQAIACAARALPEHHGKERT